MNQYIKQFSFLQKKICEEIFGKVFQRNGIKMFFCKGKAPEMFLSQRALFKFHPSFELIFLAQNRI